MPITFPLRFETSKGWKERKKSSAGFLHCDVFDSVEYRLTCIGVEIVEAILAKFSGDCFVAHAAFDRALSNVGVGRKVWAHAGHEAPKGNSDVAHEKFLFAGGFGD